MEVIETRLHGKYWINLAQNKNQYRAFVNTVMSFRVP
jgi:hypothetical protein